MSIFWNIRMKIGHKNECITLNSLRFQHLKYSVDFFFYGVVVDARFGEFTDEVINGAHNIRHFFTCDVTVTVYVVQRKCPP